ncbi:MAG TPA: DUF1707 domain-containing protein [Trebonia sp.]|jgi:hypothetical protein|nr:DUF1707 domain-containing protein [Trebonia sp.]
MDEASLRASDSDRERTLAALRDHLVAGRLTLEEFSARADAALRATVAGELAGLQDDLPDSLMKAPDSRRRPARFTAALFGHLVRRGRFRLRRWTVGASVFGDLDLDLRDATMDEGRASVTVLAAFGNVDVYVPEGVNADVGGLSIFGHRRDWGRDAGHSDAACVHVRVIGFAGTIDVWRVPRDLRDSSYREIVRTLNDRRRQLH